MKSISIVEFFATIAPLPIFISALIGINKLGRASRSERNIIVLLIVGLLAQVAATVLWWKSVNNLFISHYFTILEGFLLLNYYTSFFKSTGKKLVRLGALVFVIFSVSQVAFSFPDLGINAVSKGLESALLIIVSLAVWRKIMSEYSEENLLSLTVFWINSAVLIYFSAGLLLFVFSEAILAGKQSAGLSLWGIHLFFMTVYYLLIGIGLWKISRK